MIAPTIGGLQQTTNYKVVLPFYAFAALSLLSATILLIIHTDIADYTHINPHTLSITHTMALGWGTMVIFGASYQLLPVLIEGKLNSDLLAYLTFIFSGLGIPILIYGFYIFDFEISLPIGAILVNIGVLCYLLNVLLSSFKSEKRNIHAWYIITATLWLFSTTFFGLLLVFNLNTQFLPQSSWQYLEIHAHLGVIGWFLLLVIGVGSRLIPMFLISKYVNNKFLWIIFVVVNLSLISFILIKTCSFSPDYYYISILLALIGISSFGIYIKNAHKARIRKKVDEQVKTSILSIVQLLLPILILISILAIFPINEHNNVALLYGFTIFFGWLTAIIIGMTFKTLPFIVWNKVYDKKAYKGKTPAPKDLFSEKIYHFTLISYLSGFVLFLVGIIILSKFILKIGAAALFLAAILYVYNTGLILFHKLKKS